MFSLNYFHIQLVAKIWLNLPVDDCHFGYNTKLTPKKYWWAGGKDGTPPPHNKHMMMPKLTLLGPPTNHTPF
jgi:hypothetical protein